MSIPADESLGAVMPQPQNVQAQILQDQGVQQPTQFPPNIAPDDPNYVMGNVGAAPDVQATMQNLQNGAAQAPQQPQVSAAPVGPEAFAAKPEETPGYILPQGPEFQTINELEAAHRLQIKGLKAAADAGATKASEQAKYQDGLDANFADRAAKVQKLQQDASSKADAQMQQLKTIQNSLLNPSDDDKVNANRANPFVSGDTGQKLAAGIAIALGGIGGALTRQGGNVGLDMINKIIDRDVDQQKFNIEKNLMRKKMGMEVSQNLLQDLHQQFGDQMQAEAATKAIMLEQAKNKLDSISSKYQSPEIQGKALELKGQLDAEQAKNLYTFRQSAYQRQFMQSLMQGGQPGEMPAQALKMLPKEYQETYVPGYGFAPNKEDKEAFQKTRAELEPLTTEIDGIMRDVKSGAFNKLNPVDRAKMATRLNGLLGPLREKYGFKTMTEGDLDFLQKSVGNPNKIFTTASIELAKLQELGRETKFKINSEAKIRGLQPKSDLNLGFKPRGQ
jgi:hypothetical protein